VSRSLQLPNAANCHKAFDDGHYGDPFDAPFALQRALDARLDSDWIADTTTGGGTYPPINVFQKGDDFVAVTELLGVNKTDLQIEAKENTVRVSGKKTINYDEAAEEKIRVVLDGLRGEHPIAELCRREGIAESLYYSWSKEFLEAGKRRLAGDTARSATNSEVKDLKRQAQELKEVVAEQALELRLLKKA
jgi:transposase